MTKVSKADVLKLAHLARLKLTDEEVVRFADEFSEILGYVDQLEGVNTEGLKPTYRGSVHSTVTRADEVIDYGANQQVLLKNVPEVQENQIKVKRVI